MLCHMHFDIMIGYYISALLSTHFSELCAIKNWSLIVGDLHLMKKKPRNGAFFNSIMLNPERT